MEMLLWDRSSWATGQNGGTRGFAPDGQSAGSTVGSKGMSFISCLGDDLVGLVARKKYQQPAEDNKGGGLRQL